MNDWNSVIGDNPYMPGGLGLDETVDELVRLLRSPDPAVRDAFAYTRLARLVPHLDAERRGRLGDAMLPAFDDPETHVRTFAPLILAVLVDAGEFRATWLSAFEAWYPAEADLRGHDAERGWLHAFAHGADLLGEFGCCEHVAPASMLDLAARRLLAQTDYILRDQEDDRLAHAIAMTLTREDLAEADAVGWLDAIEADFKAGSPGPVPAHASNTMRTLRMLYLLVVRGVRPDWSGSAALEVRHRDAVERRLAEVLALVAPFAG